MTLVFRAVVCEVEHDEYVMARFWMRDETGTSRLYEMCCLSTLILAPVPNFAYLLL